MPKILDSAVKKIMKWWKTKSQAYAIAVSSLKKSKILDKNMKLTKLWKARQKLWSKWRSKKTLSQTKKSLR